jgi:uncharacterized protein YndB with AHSA1/START domain
MSRGTGPLAAALLLLLALALMLGAAAPARAAERSIDKSIDVPAGLDPVWDAWTTREGVIAFFAPDARIEARVGGAFEIHFDPDAPAGQRGADEMRFLALQPRRMLSFDWNAPPSLPEVRSQRTVVVVRFEPLGERLTRVRLHHTGWGDGGQWDQAFVYFDRAWGHVLANLKQRFEQGPTDWSAWREQLRQRRAQSGASAPR